MTDLASQKAIAETLGVTGNQVYMWHQRRHKNGFPDAIASTLVPQYPGDKTKTPLFDLSAVIDWYAAYDPLSRNGKHWAEKREAKNAAIRPDASRSARLRRSRVRRVPDLGGGHDSGSGHGDGVGNR